MHVVIAGGGVAGSSLALHLASRGVKVELYDRMKSYGKACGDALTLRPGIERLVEETGSYRGEVSRYTVKVEGREVAHVDLGRRNWVIIDKRRLVDGLRGMAEAEGAKIHYRPWRGEKGEVTVDARGPYAWHLKGSVMVYRIIARTRWDRDHALLDFRVTSRGFYWVFPADPEGRTVNIGGGFEEHPKLGEVKASVFRYTRQLLGDFEVLDERGAPVTVKGPILLHDGEAYRVGEAAGLVISTAGEGNRPALMSAEALAGAILSRWPNGVLGEYKRRISGLIAEVKASRMLLSFVESRPREGARVMSSLPPEFWRDYFRSRVTIPRLALLGLRSPRLLGVLPRVLLASRS